MTAINNTVKTNNAPDYASLLEDALNGPAEQLASFRVFHKYSAANRQLAAQQLRMRGIPLSPLSTFKHWQSQGVNVLKGQKAISLYMPVTKKEEVERNGEVVEETKSFFVMRPNWFALSQTDGWNEGKADISTPEGIDWNAERCLAALGIEVESFDNSIALDGNCGGYAYRDKDVIALNPLWGNPLAVLAHEVAHKLLHAIGTPG
nr:ssDNA-binding domain-containing protein [Pseudomonadota bacterium]